MLSTAIELLDATRSSVFDEDIMAMAGELHTRRNELPDEIFAEIKEVTKALSSHISPRVIKAVAFNLL